ncbi:MAG: alpha/beta hydrolase [Actinobacteria bacterium]|nr:alpha/beta hydrolase [Actinomycetota bacterium]MBU1942996.1 alpha/beta hydrolase [Actinomycetota bacterium]MBU2687764.1 alpha/beta hydrolase [Actinomycetota bacterium]
MKRRFWIEVLLILVVGTAMISGCGTSRSETYRPEEVPARQVKVGDVNISYREYGEGYPLVLLMGLSGTMGVWDPYFITELSKNNRIIMFDYRGIGKSGSGSKRITIEQFADDTSGLMDALKVTRANVLGWSMGTYVAQEFVLAYPEKTNKVVLYAADFGGEKAVMPSQEVIDAMTDQTGSPQDREQRSMETLFPAEWLENPKNQEYLKEVFGKYSDTPTGEAVEGQLEAWRSWRGTYDRLPQIENETLLISGASDINTPWQNTPMMFERLPNAWMTLIKGGGHGVMFQQPREMASVINGFLE